MSPAKRQQIDPMEKAIEAVLSPGRFISYNAAWSFVEDVQGVADDIDKYYDAALDHIEHAKKCYSKAGLDASWQAVVADVRKRHFRKKGFMAGFEDIVVGVPKQVEPSFLERAKARWPRKPKRS